MPSLHERVAIAVMAKAPKAGRVKTRLCPPLLPEEAVEMSAAFLRDITTNIREAARAAPVDGWIAYAPEGDAHAFDGMLADGTRLVLADGAIDVPDGVEGFGRSLLHAMRALFERGYGGVVVLNSDSPTLPTALLVQTAAALLRPGGGAVLGPADDGGYYLLGLTAPHAEAFSAIAWSSATVAATTRQRIATLGLELVELAPWYDIDDAAALRRLLADFTTPAEAAVRPYPAPSTAACIERMSLPSRL